MASVLVVFGAVSESLGVEQCSPAELSSRCLDRSYWVELVSPYCHDLRSRRRRRLTFDETADSSVQFPGKAWVAKLGDRRNLRGSRPPPSPATPSVNQPTKRPHLAKTRPVRPPAVDTQTSTPSRIDTQSCTGKAASSARVDMTDQHKAGDTMTDEDWKGSWSAGWGSWSSGWGSEWQGSSWQGDSWQSSSRQPSHTFIGTVVITLPGSVTLG